MVFTRQAMGIAAQRLQPSNAPSTVSRQHDYGFNEYEFFCQGFNYDVIRVRHLLAVR